MSESTLTHPAGVHDPNAMPGRFYVEYESPSPLAHAALGVWRVRDSAGKRNRHPIVFRHPCEQAALDECAARNRWERPTPVPTSRY